LKKTIATLGAVLSLAACSDQDPSALEPAPDGISTFSVSADLRTTRLAWSGSSAPAFDIYRDGAIQAVVGGDASAGYVDVPPAPGSYTYQVCETSTRVCTSSQSVTTH
jgi:hypothetical protein